MDERPSRQDSDMRMESIQPGRRRDGVATELRSLAHWLYTNNPFYAASAALTFAGLRMSFDTGGSAFQTSGLMLALVTYTLVLAGAAWFLIRYARLWEDARTLLLLVVLMLLAISVSFDDTLAANSSLGVPLFIIGLVFAIGLCEGLLRAIGLRLATGYRLPLHGVLGVFFLYPVLLSQWIRTPESPALSWGLFGFSTAAGAAFLTLLPAIRRGAAYVGDNGSPWRWPWYPWALFVVLGFGVCIRASYLCIAFHFVGVPQTIFAPYFLVPFFLVVAILLLEAGGVSRQKALLVASLLVVVGTVGLAVTASPDHARDLGFLRLFHDTLGASPLFLTLGAASVFTLFAWWRGAPGAFVFLALSVATFSICGTSTFNMSTLAGPWGLPLLVTAAMVLAQSVWRRSTPLCLVGGWCAVVALWIDYCNLPSAAHQMAVLVHSMLAVVLVTGGLFRDAAAVWLQRLGATVLLALALTAVVSPADRLGDPPQWLLFLYPLFMASIALTYGTLVKNPFFLASATGCMSAWLAVHGWGGYQQARRSVVGLDYIISGVAFFVVAMLVSLSKTDMLRRLVRRQQSRN